MKEEINLLPPSAQRLRWQQLYIVKARSLYRSLLIALGIIGLGYAGAWGVLFWALQDSTSALQASEEGTNEFDAKTQDINAKIKVVHDRLKQQPFSPQLTRALLVVPNGVTITEVAVDRAEDTITLSGRSENRSAIVQFENVLREEPWAGAITAPLQNFASGPNVTFQFTIKRKL